MNHLHELFKLGDKKLDLSEGQREIFYSIVDLEHPRTQIIAPTQYGKTLTVACAVLVSAVAMGEKFTVLAPSEKKAAILMRYVIEHTFDQPMFMQALELQDNISLDRLRRERSREHLTFRGGGGVQVLSLDARNSRRSIEAAMGFGGNRVILDESSLIEDDLYATVKRMLGGHKYKDTLLLEIGNPFYRNHFLRTWRGSRYKKIFIDYKQGLREGRYSHEHIDEAREEAFFDVFYECKFPEADAIDSRGYRNLVTDDLLSLRTTDSKGRLFEKKKKKSKDKPKRIPLKLGADIGGGGDFNVYVVRSPTVAWVESKNQSNDTMVNVTEIERIAKKYKIAPYNIFIDDIGIGRGVTDRLKEKGLTVKGVSAGASPIDKSRYMNQKAEIYWNLRSWLNTNGKLKKHDGWLQLLGIKYKVSTDKVVQIEPKAEMVKRTGKSPDYSDALSLTFAVADPQPGIRFI